MRKFLSIVLTLAFVLSTLALCVVPAAAAEVEIGKVASDYTPAEGAVAINSEADFLAMTAGGSYYLASDITVNTTLESFSGTFDGCGRTITTSVPLFLTIENATIKNFTINGEIAFDNIATTPMGGVDDATAFVGAALAVNANGDVTLDNMVNNANISTKWRLLPLL